MAPLSLTCVGVRDCAASGARPNTMPMQAATELLICGSIRREINRSACELATGRTYCSQGRADSPGHPRHGAATFEPSARGINEPRQLSHGRCELDDSHSDRSTTAGATRADSLA